MKKGKLNKNIFYEDDGTNVIVFGNCVFSGEQYSTIVPSEGFNKWITGMLIQRALSEITPENREFLISGISPLGWNETFKDV